ncbi:DnaD domain protein [Amphibacillus sp. Q70]|uniref:DnaD domain protein n=1 Tax=Amphibacillus sp. Q70 TaxID=3453416 RepID=UPI003F86AD72
MWRDKQTCFYTGSKLQLKDIHVDHIIPKSAKGDGTPRNLVVSSPKFNLLKSGNNNIKSAIDEWNEKYPHKKINYIAIQKKINDLQAFERLRGEHEITYRKTIKNKLYDTYSIYEYLNTTHDQSDIQEEEQEVEEEKEEYKEQEQQQEIEKKIDSSGGRNFNDPDFKEILEFYRDNIQKGVTETPFNYELLKQFYDEWGKDLMFAALKLAAKKEAGIPFIEAVFKNWKKYGIKTVEDAARFNESLRNKQKYANHPMVDNTPDWYHQNKAKEKEKKKKELTPEEELKQKQEVEEFLNKFKANKAKSG